MKIFQLYFHFACTLCLCSCQFSSPPTKLTTFSQNIMTIDYHISIGDPVNAQNTIIIQKIIQATFQEIDAVYNKWNPHSELSTLNSLPAHVSYPLSPSLHQFFKRMDELVKISGGRFDPTIEPLQKLWKDNLEKGKYPNPKEIEEMKPCIGWDTIHFENGIFSKEDSRTQLDFGGIAKGLCVDLLVERLYHAGFRSLFVEWGGEIRTQGLHPTGRPWHVYISHLANTNPSQAIAHIELVNQALATSGDYFQFWVIPLENGEEKTYCHIFNPFTLAPLESKNGSIASASILAHDCVTADALAKVLMLFETPEEAQRWLENLQKQYPYLACWIGTRQNDPLNPSPLTFQ